MYTRLLTILAVSAFVLTLLFAVAAGAQDETTDTAATLGDGGGIQVQQSQQVQQQQVGPAAAPSPPRGPLAGARVFVSGGDAGHKIENGDTLRINGDYQVEEGASITIEDADGTQGTFVDGRNANITETEDGIRIEVTGKPIGVVDTGSNPDGELDEGGRVEAVASDGVRVTGSGGGGGNGGNNNGGSGDSTDTTDTTDGSPVTPAQTDDTTGATTGTTDPNATTDPATADATADPAAEDTSIDRPDSGSFRCDLFLRVVRDDRGALRAQYRDGDRDDELVVQRFEQCLEADVLANTIPDKTLPFTGGPSLPFGGGVLLLVTGAALALRMVRR